MLGVNALDYFAAPCMCGQCKADNEAVFRYAQRRNWDQFFRFYFTCLGVRGSYIQAEYMHDPEVIEAQATASDDDWRPSPPSLFGWTDVIDKLTNLGDQLIASRAQGPDGVKFYPRPTYPGMKEREKRREKKVAGGIEAAMKRGADAAKWNYL